MWNLFAQRFDNTLIKLLTCEQQHLWNVTMVQLVSLMYREQHQSTISKLIHEWLELSLCESSTDDENNTLSSSSYDAVSTSDPVSDSSERLFPVEGGRCSKVKPNTNILVNDKIFSSNSQCLNTTSSKDSGFGRSSSNNEGETSVDESIQEWATNQQENKDNKLGNECIPSVINNSEGLNKNKIEYPSSVQHIKCKMEAVDIEDVYSEETLKQIRSVFDTAGNDSNDLTQSININNKINFSENLNEFVKTEESATLEEYKNANSQVRGKTKKPPDENESYSGDSSEKRPPHPLPKLAKGKILLPGQKRSRHCMSQKMMNEKQEMQDLSNSTGSDCDDGPHAKRPTHQKPHKMLVKPRPSKLIQKALQERNMKRTKIMKRKESGGMKAKALLHHQPTPEDISNLLKEFTLDFMLNGYATLVQGLRMQVLLPFQMQLDKSHLLWLITYFLRFAVELDLELSQICPVLSVEIVSYLVYEGVVMQEELEIAIRTGVGNILPYVRRLHLVVTALREFFISFDVCLKKDPFTVDSKQLTNIKDDICNLVELRQVFVFLIRMYRPGVLTLNYLEDLITTNHRFLIIQEPSESSEAAFDMIAHIKQFATMDIMRQYGRILENFNKNSEMVNDCIFTMMHHIAGELRAVNVLLQPSILKVFLLIWKEGYELCVDWADLIEYVLRKCTKKRAKSCHSMDCVTIGKSEDIQLTIEDVDQLSTLYSSFNEQDLLEKIKDICCDDSLEKPIKKEVNYMKIRNI
ncbi:Protein timeless [Armadillidium vulgare]|nr:Protein timeless [Armadillidium vulgare]